MRISLVHVLVGNSRINWPFRMYFVSFFVLNCTWFVVKQLQHAQTRQVTETLTIHMFRRKKNLSFFLVKGVVPAGMHRTSVLSKIHLNSKKVVTRDRHNLKTKIDSVLLWKSTVKTAKQSVQSIYIYFIRKHWKFPGLTIIFPRPGSFSNAPATA